MRRRLPLLLLVPALLLAACGGGGGDPVTPALATDDGWIAIDLAEADLTRLIYWDEGTAFNPPPLSQFTQALLER